uniref:Coiled-coil domain-containing protein 134 n=1 Tax=Strigamia maritima TaxID=126957 RepID=T1IWX0_STRMM
MLWIYTVMLMGIVIRADSTSNSSESGYNIHKQEEIYKSLFKLKHSEQLKVVKQIISKADYAKQFKMVQIIIDGMIKVVMGPAKVLLENSGYFPGEDFPVSEEAKDALSLVVENTVLFSEILLRLPDITHRHLKRLKETSSVFKWGIVFCNESHLMDATRKKLLSLAAQELEMVPKSPNYVNPFRFSATQDKEIVEPVKVKKKKTRVRGPQLSKNSEL